MFRSKTETTEDTQHTDVHVSPVGRRALWVQFGNVEIKKPRLGVAVLMLLFGVEFLRRNVFVL